MMQLYKRQIILIVLVLIPIFMCSFFVNSIYQSIAQHEYVDNTKYLQREINKIEELQPDIILMGNSMLDKGVNVKLLNKYLNAKFQKFAIPGSASASWYLILKNIISVAQTPPQNVVLFFRDPFLTHAKYRTSGQYEKNILKFASQDEPLVSELVYDDLSQKAFGKLPIYAYKNQISNDVTENLKSVIASTNSDLSVLQLDKTLKKSFSAQKTQQTAVTKAQQVAESYAAFSSEEFNFQKKIDQSFLQAIIQIVKENDINLILVRVRKRDSAKGKELPANVVDYIESMNKYLEKEKVSLLDYTHFADLQEKHYADGDHLNEKGMAIFTKQIAKDLKKELNLTVAEEFKKKKKRNNK